MFAAVAAQTMGVNPAPIPEVAAATVSTPTAAVETSPANPASRAGVAALLWIGFVVIFFGILWGVGELTGEALFKKASAAVAAADAA
jgi:cytoskeletal protein RodZ